MSNGIGHSLTALRLVGDDDHEIREFARKNRMSEQRARDVIQHVNMAVASAAANERRNRKRSLTFFAR